MDSMDIRVINHDHEAIDAIDGPVDEPEAMVIDVKPSIASPIAELIKNYPIHSTNVIAHIRKATQGEIKLENCHPFRRELTWEPENIGSASPKNCPRRI